MPLYRRGAAPVDVTLGARGALRVTLGNRVIWDGTTPVTIPAAPMRATGSMPDPVLVVGVEPSVSPMAAAATMPPAEIRAGATVAASSAAAEVVMPGPTLSVGVTVEASPMEATAVMPPASVGETVVEASPMEATAVMPAASVVTGVTVLAEAAEAVASMPPPDIAVGVTVEASPMEATATMPEAEIEMGVTHTDNFNRASLGAGWAVVGSLTPVITGSEKAQAGTGGTVNTTSAYVARYATAVTSDTHRSCATLVAPTGSANLNLGVGLWVRGTSGGDRVEAVVTPDQVTFYTKTGGSGGTSTSRHNQTGLSIATGAFIELVADDATYTVYANGVEVASWTDTGGVIPIDSSHRHVGIAPRSNRSFSSTYTYGWALDDWIGRDG